MTNLVSKLVVVVAAMVAILAGIGGTLGVQRYLLHPATASAAKPAHPVAQPPKPIYFADLADVVVSVPPQAGAQATSYVDFDMQFATNDAKAPVDFSALQPIIKAEIVNLVMNQTSAALQEPATRAGLIQQCLAIANNVLAKDAIPNTPPPFYAAYITSLVIQD
jgi:flagellar basal body-associated protein FliL